MLSRVVRARRVANGSSLLAMARRRIFTARQPHRSVGVTAIATTKLTALTPLRRAASTASSVDTSTVPR